MDKFNHRVIYVEYLDDSQENLIFTIEMNSFTDHSTLEKLVLPKWILQKVVSEGNISPIQF